MVHSIELLHFCLAQLAQPHLAAQQRRHVCQLHTCYTHGAVGTARQEKAKPAVHDYQHYWLHCDLSSLAGSTQGGRRMRTAGCT